MAVTVPFEPPPHARHRLLIVELPEGHRRLVARHLLRLTPEDRRLRFGRPMNDCALLRYARGIDFERDTVFGAFDDTLDLVGLAHIGIDPERAELGLSVVAAARRRGVASALLARALTHARARGLSAFEMAFLPENAALRALAARAGMTIVPDREEPRALAALSPLDPDAGFREALDAALGNADLGFRLAAAGGSAPATTSA